MLLRPPSLLALWLVACSERPSPSPVPELVCRAPRHDFGRVLEGQKLERGFRLENPSSSTLVVHGVDGGYACRPVSVPSHVPTRGSATLEVACETAGHPAHLFERLTVRTGAPALPRLELELKAQIAPLLAFETTLVELRTTFGEPVERSVGLTGPLAGRGNFRVIEVTEPGVEANVVGKALHLRLSATAVGKGAGHVRVATGLERPEELSLPYSFEVKGNLVVDPERPYVNLRLPEPRQVSFTVTSSRDDFTLRSVEVSEGPFEARFSQRAPGTFEVDVRVREEERPKDSAFSGRAVLTSNDPYEPRKVVPLFALGVTSP